MIWLNIRPRESEDHGYSPSWLESDPWHLQLLPVMYTSSKEWSLLSTSAQLRTQDLTCSLVHLPLIAVQALPAPGWLSSWSIPSAALWLGNAADSPVACAQAVCCPGAGMCSGDAAGTSGSCSGLHPWHPAHPRREGHVIRTQDEQPSKQEGSSWLSAKPCFRKTAHGFSSKPFPGGFFRKLLINLKSD